MICAAEKLCYWGLDHSDFWHRVSPHKVYSAFILFNDTIYSAVFEYSLLLIPCWKVYSEHSLRSRVKCRRDLINAKTAQIWKILHPGIFDDGVLSARISLFSTLFTGLLSDSWSESLPIILLSCAPSDHRIRRQRTEKRCAPFFGLFQWSIYLDPAGCFRSFPSILAILASLLVSWIW